MKRNYYLLEVKNGDIVTIFSVIDRVDNYVQVEGNVLRPGRYSYQNGLTLKDMIQKSAGLDEDTFKERVDIYRYVSKNKRRILSRNINDTTQLATPIADKDIIRFYSKLEAIGSAEISASGAVKEAGSFKLLEGMRVSDAVFLAKLDLFADQGIVEVFRREVGTSPKLITVPLRSDPTQPRK